MDTRRRRVVAGVVVACATALTFPALGQSVDGSVSLMADVLPAVERATGEADAVSELRARVFVERRFTRGERLRVVLAGFGEGLVADREAGGVTRAAILRPQEAHAEGSWTAGDLRVGLSRVVWGRLDELQPTDVVNPLDVTRFFFEGRSEARMPVGMIRGRFIPSERLAVEGIYVPFFRRGQFDQLDARSSPFNLGPEAACLGEIARTCQPPSVRSHEPGADWRDAQGGARVNVTTGRVDWSLSTYRGFESLPLYQTAAVNSTPGALLQIDERFPRFTMIGGDFETVRGPLGIRGEVAGYVDRTLQVIGRPAVVAGRTVEGGIGLDRRAGAYRVSGNVLFVKRWVDTDGPANDSSSGTTLPLVDATDVSLVVSVDRSFARETRTLRSFAVYNPEDASAFARVIAIIVLRDNLSFEASGGLFTGTGVDVLSRLRTRDFVSARLKVFF